MKPPIFSELAFEAAITLAKEQKKLLLVDATASWCGPCQVMDRTTWVDPKVVVALTERVIAIQVDVDTQAEVAKRLHIKGMPTVVAFENGAELDRVVGLQKSDQLLAWLDGLARGDTSLQRLRRDAASRPDDMQLRMEVARRLFGDLDLEGATAEYLWLWKNILAHDPDMYGVRHSFLVTELKELVHAHAPARAAFSAIRDEVVPSVEDLASEAAKDWFSLNSALGEQHATLAWFDANRERLVANAAPNRLLDLEFIPLLVEAGRWADVASLYVDPLGELRSATLRRDELLEHATSEDLPEGIAPHLEALASKQVCETAVQLIRALRAAGRNDEAAKVAEEARSLDGSERMTAALVDVIGLAPGSPATSSDSTVSSPPHRAVVELLLDRGSVDLYVDPRRPGVIAPPKFKNDVRLVLSIGRSLRVPIPDLALTDDGFSGTLSFDPPVLLHGAVERSVRGHRRGRLDDGMARSDAAGARGALTLTVGRGRQRRDEGGHDHRRPFFFPPAIPPWCEHVPLPVDPETEPSLQTVPPPPPPATKAGDGAGGCGRTVVATGGVTALLAPPGRRSVCPG